MANRRSFLHSVKWAYTANWGERAFSALFVFVLAAILGPHDFGVISIAMTQVFFLQMFLDQGLASALIQRKDLKQEHLDAVFWMDLALSLILLILSVVFSSWWARVNHAPEARLVISVISISIVIEALSVVQTALLRREMDFKSLSIRTNASVVISGVVGLTMALAGFRVWALVCQQIVRDLTALTLLWRLSTWRPRFEFSFRHLRELLGFSVPNFTAQLANFADTQASPILLGLLFGPVALGLYRLADRLVNCVVVMATSSIQAVSLPEFSRLQDKPPELRTSAISCIRLSAYITLPALAGLAAVSNSLMATIGVQWVPAAGALKVLCPAGMAIIFAYFTGPLMQALARTRQLAIIEWLRTIAGLTLLITAGMLVRGAPTSQQVLAVALSRLVAAGVIVAPAFLYVFMKLCGISFRDFTTAIGPSVFASVGITLTVTFVSASGLLGGRRPAEVLTLEAITGALAGILVLLAADAWLRSVLVSFIGRRVQTQLVHETE